MYVYFQELFDLSSKQTSKIDIFSDKLDHRVGGKLRMCVFVCVFVRGATCKYIL